MSDVVEEKQEEVKETESPTKRKPGRPRKPNPGERSVTRDTRTPVGGFAGPLSLENKDPNYRYFWEIDSSEDGSKIERRLQAGYVFCRNDEGLVVGETSVYKTENVGSIIRVPAGQGHYHYLMKIPKEWHEDDQKRHDKRVDTIENSLKSKSREEGFYGDLSINRK